MLISAIVVAVVSVAVVVGVALCGAGRIGRNPLVGLRVPALFASDEAWTVGHRAGVAPTACAAVVCVALAVLIAIIPAFALAGTFLMLLCLIAGLVVAVVVGSRKAREVPAP